MSCVNLYEKIHLTNTDEFNMLHQRGLLPPEGFEYLRRVRDSQSQLYSCRDDTHPRLQVLDVYEIRPPNFIPSYLL